MSKLSEPVAKALQALLDKCKGDTMVFMRTITGNYSEENYFFNLIDEIKLIRCANFDDILIALVEGLPQAIKTTEQPSAASAVEGLEGILTEEELKQFEMLYGIDTERGKSDAPALTKLVTSYRHLLSTNAELKAEAIMLREFQKSSDEIIGDFEENLTKQNEEICKLQDEISKLRGENE